MKLQRSTLILVSVALLMGAGVLIAESQRNRSPDTAEVGDTSGAPIFPFEEAAVTGLTVERQGETLTFELDEAGNWQMVAPTAALAEPGAVAFLLSRLNTDAPLETVTMTADQIADFGLDAPSGQVTITLADGSEHQLFLGGKDFSGNAYYAVIDPETWPLPAGDEAEYSALVVSQDVANGINRPLEEWKMPVEAADDTPQDKADTGDAEADTANEADNAATADELDEADTPSDTVEGTENPDPTPENPTPEADTDAAAPDAAADNPNDGDDPANSDNTPSDDDAEPSEGAAEENP
jgi:hypothetical protein